MQKYRFFFRFCPAAVLTAMAVFSSVCLTAGAGTITGNEAYFVHSHTNSCYATETISCNGQHREETGVKVITGWCDMCQKVTKQSRTETVFTCTVQSGQVGYYASCMCRECGGTLREEGSRAQSVHTVTEQYFTCGLSEGERTGCLRITANDSWTNAGVSLSADINILKYDLINEDISYRWSGGGPYVTENGIYSVSATNGAGQTISSGITISCIDKNPPVIYSVTGNTSSMKKDRIEVTVNAQDGESGLHDAPYSLDGGSSWSGTSAFTIREGECVHVMVRDRAGNVSGCTVQRSDFPYPPEPTPTPTVRPTVSPTERPTVSPTASPTAMPTLTPVPAPTSTVKETSAPVPTQTPAPTSTVKATSAPVSTQTPAPTSTAQATSAPVPTQTPAPTSTAKATSAPVPTQTPAPVPTERPTVSPTASPTAMPTLTPVPAPTSTVKETSAPVPTQTPAPTSTVKATSAPVSTQTPAPTSTAQATSAPVPTQTPAPTPTAKATTAPGPTQTPAPVPTASPKVSPTARPAAVPTLAPTPVPVPAPTPTAKATSAPLPTQTPAPTPTAKATSALLPTQTPAPTPVPASTSLEEPTAPIPIPTPAVVPMAQPTSASIPVSTLIPTQKSDKVSGSTELVFGEPATTGSSPAPGENGRKTLQETAKENPQEKQENMQDTSQEKSHVPFLMGTDDNGGSTSKGEHPADDNLMLMQPDGGSLADGYLEDSSLTGVHPAGRWPDNIVTLLGILLLSGALLYGIFLIWLHSVQLYCYDGGEEYRRLGILHLKKGKKEFTLFLPEYLTESVSTPRYRLILKNGLVKRGKKMELVVQNEEHKLRQPLEECIDFML